jgi:DNA-binding beta-propeller fold protein YncE
MIRLMVLCLTLTALQTASAETSRIYGSAPYWVLAPTSTTTFTSPGIIPTQPGAGDMQLSPDGKTLFFIQNGGVVAMDIATNKTLHTYQTMYPIPLEFGLLPFAVLPNESQIYVATCDYYLDVACIAGYVEVFDVGTEQELAVISMDQDQVYGLAVAPNGATVYAVHSYNDCCDARLHSYTRPRAHAGPLSVPSNSVTAIDVVSLQPGASFTPPGDIIIPQSIVVAAGSQTGYVLSANFYFNESGVFAVDLTDMTATAGLVPAASYFGVAMMMSGNGATLALQLSGELEFFSATSGTLIETVSTPGGLSALSPDGKTAYTIVGSGINGDPVASLQTVAVETGTTNTVVTGEYISGVLPLPNGEAIYLILGTGVLAFNEGVTSASALYNVGVVSSWMAVSPDGATLYSAGQNGVWAVSTTTGAATAKLLGSMQIAAIALSPAGNLLYALDADTFSLVVLNTSTGAVEKTIALPQCTANVYLSGSIAMGSTGALAFAAVNPCGSVIVVDLKTQTVVGQIPGTSGPALAVSPVTGYLWSSADSSVEVYDLATNQVVGTIPLDANSIAFSPDGTTAYVAGSQDNVAGVGVVDTSTLVITDFLAGGGGSGGQSVAVTPDGKWVYVGGGDVIDAQSLQVVGQFTAAPPVVVH